MRGRGLPLMALARRLWRLATFDEVRVLADVLGPGRTGLMLDVGGHRGSSARPFLDAGWVVHSFEPDPANRRHLELLGEHHDGALTVWPNIVSDVSGRAMDLFSSPTSTGVSTVQPFLPTHELAVTVQSVSIRDVVESEGIAQVDFLKIDVEGHEMEVLRGVDWERGRPSVVLAEFDSAKGTGTTAEAIFEFLVERGLTPVIVEWEPVRRYGALHRPRAVREHPSEVADRAWGNVVAFSDGTDVRDSFVQLAGRRITTARWLWPGARLVHRYRARRA